MRLAGHTYAFRDLPLDAALDRLSAIGFTHVELWLGHCDEPHGAAAVVGQSGLQVQAVSAGGYYRADDDAPTRAFALAEAVGAPTVVLCVRPELAQSLATLTPDGLTVAVENHWDQPLDTSRRVLAALRSAPSLAACLDTGHALAAGERPEDAARSLGPHLAHVHLKDASARTPLQALLGRRLRKRVLDCPPAAFPGTGALEIATLRGRLAEQGFDGWVSCEHEGADPAGALTTLRQAWLDGR